MHLKCDETKPICKQCVKSRRECSGYRSDFDILHRDETRATETRAKKAAAKKAAKRAADGGGGGAIIQFEALPKPHIKQEPPTTTTTFTSWQASPPAADRTTSPPSSSTALTTTAVPSAAHTHAHTVPRETRFPIAAPALPLDQHAAHYFAAHFIMLPGEHGTKNGHLNYLVPLLRTETNPSSAFQLAYSACGLAAMSNREKAVHTDLVELAFMQHGRALQAVGAALRDPVLCKRDATLAAVLLLTFFEVCCVQGGLCRRGVGCADTVNRIEHYGFQGSRTQGMAVPCGRVFAYHQVEGIRDVAAEQVFHGFVQRRAPANRTLFSPHSLLTPSSTHR